MKNYTFHFNLIFTTYKFLLLKKHLITMLLLITSTFVVAQATDTSSLCIIVCPLDIVVVSDPGVCGATVNLPTLSMSDSCSFTVEGPGPVIQVSGESETVVYNITDSNGNASSCIVNIIVVDLESPGISCSPNLSTTITDGTCSQSVTWEVSATDNCGVDTINSFCIYPDGNQAPCSSGDEYPIGTTVVVNSAIDNSGNATTCSFLVNVSDARPNDLFFTGSISNNTSYAKQNITSNGNVSNGGNVSFKAGQSIELQNNFTVQANADFSAEISNCN